MEYVRKLAQGFLGWIGGTAAASGLLYVAPERVREWADTIGVTPGVVVLGMMLWSVTQRQHMDNLNAIRDCGASIRALTAAIVQRTMPRGEQDGPSA